MCARFTFRTESVAWIDSLMELLATRLSATESFGQLAKDESKVTGRFNIAPTQSILMAAMSKPDRGSNLGMGDAFGGALAVARWGLLPSWADDLQMGSRMVNARSETVATKPAFRAAFASRRCVIPADGYFEWKQEADGKQPYLMHRKDESGFFMAGLWEQNHKLSKVRDQPITSCTILTTRPNERTAAIHDRMPVIFGLEDAHRWMTLDGKRDREDLLGMLEPVDGRYLEVTPVSRRVNSVRNDDRGCVRPADRQGELF